MLSVGIVHDEKVIRNMLCNALGISSKRMHGEEIDAVQISRDQYSSLFKSGPNIAKILNAIQAELIQIKTRAEN